jgi:putative aldouronate transport system permease protein
MQVERVGLKTTDSGKSKHSQWWSRLAQQWDLQLIMVWPAIGLLLLFHYVPMWGVLMSFQDYSLFNGFWGSEWVGFKHFEMFFGAPEFWNIMRNTLVISLLKLFFGFPAPILLALALNEVRFNGFKRVVQTISYLPHFMSWVIISGVLFTLLSVEGGTLNDALVKLKMIDQPINWLSTPEYFWTILVASGVWKEIGFGAIVYLAAIAGIDPHLYEAASIDGAGRVRQIFQITIPCIAPVIIIFLILSISGILNAGFDDILNLTNNGENAIVRPVSDVIDTYVYRVGILNGRYSYAVAAGLFKAIFSFLLLVIANYTARRLGRSSLW